MQAVNTWRTWEGTVQKTTPGGRIERNFVNDVTTAGAQEDNQVIEDLSSVLGKSVTMAFA